MDNEIIAKTRKETKNGVTKIITETLEEHTGYLLNKVKDLEKYYKNEIEEIGTQRIWQMLKYSCLFHDLGKTSHYFQDKIRKAAKIEPSQSHKKKQSNLEIPHNYLSPAFLTSLDASKINPKEFLILFYSIAFHHNKKLDNFNENDLNKTIKNEMLLKLDSLKWLEKHDIKLNNELDIDYLDMLKTSSGHYKTVKKEKDYIFTKGLFHRVDHCASGHLDIETERIKNPQEKLINYLKTEYNGNLKPFQVEAEEYREQSIILPASTGMGKTEFALNWIGNDKAFYVLPLRVSVNAMYQRFCNIFKEDEHNIGLLHGDSLSQGFDDKEIEDLKKIIGISYTDKSMSDENQSIEEHMTRMEVSKQLSMPLSVTTADQLFTSVFKWKGYEKIYATLMYSKVIIDEPQSYSPQIMAMIVKCLIELSELGCKFCFMSATIHPIIRDKLGKYSKILDPVFNTELKHKIKVIDDSIDSITDIINENFDEYYSNKKKVLIICNTVKKAQEVFKNFKDIDINNVKLLHSAFIKKDRKVKETEIMKDYKKDEFVIWISTQIVEASLDIDYDILFTENAGIDAIIQRMGRVNRKNNANRIITESNLPNIYIFKNEPSDKYFIYSKEIADKTIEELLKRDSQIISEQEKQNMIDIVYSENNAKKYYTEFNHTFDLLEAGLEAKDGKKSDAQLKFREMLNVNVIPETVYNDNYQEIDAIIESINSLKDKNKRSIAIKLLNDYTLSLPIYKSQGSGNFKLPIDEKRYKGGLNFLTSSYNKFIGLSVPKEMSNQL